MWELDCEESWALKNWCFWTVWCLRRLLRVPWTARRSNQSILKEISPACSLEELMLWLKLQYFGHFMWRDDSLEKPLMLGGIGGRRRRGWQRMRWLDGITNLMDVNSGSWWWTGRPGMLWFMESQRVGYDWETGLNWTENITQYKENEIGSFIEMWMDWESVIQSEESKRGKNKYCILMHMDGISKDGTDERVCRAGIEKRHWTQGEKGREDELWEQHCHTVTVVCEAGSGKLL